MSPKSSVSFSKRMLEWYDRHRRDLPWRARRGEKADPYRIWLSEIMLQQTTVATVGPYFHKFVDRWPTVDALANSSLEDILAAWAGLGYYSRARNLHACARIVSQTLNGEFPSAEDDLRTLPGIGPYTAAAISAIAFDAKANVVDGNVERVMSRWLTIATPLPAAKPEINGKAERLLPRARFGDYAQALMDLGATVCTPRSPKCMLCPVADDCRARAAGDPERYPVKAPKKKKPTRYGTAFLAIRKDGTVLLQRRPAKGLLGAMMEVPSTEWVENAAGKKAGGEGPPLKARWKALDGQVRHTFTHFHLELAVKYANVAADTPPPEDGGECRWVRYEDLGKEALPTVMKKVIRLGTDAQVLDVSL